MRGIIYKAGAGAVGEGVSFKMTPSILLSFHSEFGEFDSFARNVEVEYGFVKESHRS